MAQRIAGCGPALHRSHGKYIAFLAYEWTTRSARSAVTITSSSVHQDHNRVPTQKAYNLSRLYYGLRAENKTNDVLIIPHAHQAGDWRRNDPDMERVVEIMSMHGTFEWFGNYYLKSGFDIGFVASSDDHRTRPGYSGTMGGGSLQQFGGLVAVKAPEKSANAIFDATLRDRYTYAVTSAQRILLDADVNGERLRAAYSIHSRLPADSRPRLRHGRARPRGPYQERGHDLHAPLCRGHIEAAFPRSNWISIQL